jgi:HK97 family phage major capsid protein
MMKNALLAGAAVSVLAARPRGIVSQVRAETQGPAAVLGELQRAWAEFQTEINARVPDAGKLAALESSISALQANIDANAQAMAALRTGIGGGGGDTPEARAHRDAFVAFARTGAMAPEARATSFNEGDGGFLVTPEMDTMINRVLANTVAMRSLANIRPIGGASLKSFASVGGSAARWSGENEDKPETDTARLVEIEITPGELYGEPCATQALLDDGFVNVETWLADELGVSFSEAEEAAFISGDGVKKPRGLLAYPVVDNANYAWGSVGVIRSGNASAFSTGTGATDRLIDLQHALKAGYRNNGTWLMSDLVLSSVRKFKDGQGNFIWQPSIAADVPATLLGKPVATSDYMPAVGAGALPIAFGDFSRAYRIVDRMGTRVTRNPYKQNGRVFFYTTKRVGGGIVNFEAVKLLQIAAD